MNVARRTAMKEELLEWADLYGISTVATVQMATLMKKYADKYDEEVEGLEEEVKNYQLDR